MSLKHFITAIIIIIIIITSVIIYMNTVIVKNVLMIMTNDDDKRFGVAVIRFHSHQLKLLATFSLSDECNPICMPVQLQ